MQQDTLTGLRASIARTRAEADALVGPALSWQLVTAPPLLSAARSSLMKVWAAFDAADGVLDQVARDVPAAWCEDQYTKAAKSDRVGALVAVAQAEVAVALTEAKAGVDQLRAKAAKVAMPARPLPADAAQEAALAGLKGDLGMVFGNVEPNRLPEAMLAELGRFVADDDKLGVWLLAGDSAWPARYLRARDPDHADDLGDRLTDALPEALAAGVQEGETELARDLLDFLDGPQGLRRAFAVMAHVAKMRLNAITANRGYAA